MKTLILLFASAGLLLAGKSMAANPHVVLHANSRIEQPGIVLTFDDQANISNWCKHASILSRYNVRVTFYIEAPDRIDAQKKEQLLSLVSAGHEIGNHGWRHQEADEMISKSGIGGWLQAEIDPAHTVLKSLGVEPCSFAYPRSKNNAKSDLALQTYYRHIRSGSSIPAGQTLAESDMFFTTLGQVSERFCLIGKGIDGADETFLTQHLFPALERIKKQGELLVLYAHDIADGHEGPHRHFVSPEILEEILKKASSLGLVFYTMNELPSRFPETQPDPR